MVGKIGKLLLAIPFIGTYLFFVLFMFIVSPVFGVISIAAPLVMIIAGIPNYRKSVRSDN